MHQIARWVQASSVNRGRLVPIGTSYFSHTRMSRWLGSLPPSALQRVRDHNRISTLAGSPSAASLSHNSTLPGEQVSHYAGTRNNQCIARSEGEVSRDGGNGGKHEKDTTQSNDTTVTFILGTINRPAHTHIIMSSHPRSRGGERPYAIVLYTTWYCRYQLGFRLDCHSLLFGPRPPCMQIMDWLCGVRERSVRLCNYTCRPGTFTSTYIYMFNITTNVVCESGKEIKLFIRILYLDSWRCGKYWYDR